jgi:PAS domain S-box-containing protein
MTFFNRRAAELWDWEPELSETEPWLGGWRQVQALDESPIANGDTPLARAAREGVQVHQWEARVVRQNGTAMIISADVEPLRNAGGHLSGAVMVFQDITQRKEAETAVLARKARFKAGARAAGVGTWALDIARQKVHVDEYVAQMFSIAETAEGVPLEPLLEVLHPEDRPRVQLTLETSMQSGCDYHAEYRLRANGGDWRWFQARGTVESDASGKPLRLMGGFMDVTERKQQEERVAELSRQIEAHARIFNTALSHITDFTYIFDREGRFMYVNKPLLDLWGLTLDEAKGQNFFDLGYPDELATRLQQQINTVIESKTVIRDETPYTSPTGKDGYYEYIFSPVFDAEGNVEVVAGSTRVITERKLAEEALKESEARFRAMADNIVQFAWMAGTDGRPFWINRRWLEYAGIPLEEIRTEEQRRALHHPDHWDRFVEKYQSHIREGTEWEDTFPLRRKDGVFRWFLSRAVPIRDENGKVLQWFGTNTDITEERQVQEALRRSEKRHRESMEGLPVACYTLDVEGGITLFNEAAVRLWGRVPKLGEKWCGSHEMSLLNGRQLPLAECPAATALREQRSVRGVEAYVHRPDGSKRQVVPHPDPLFDHEGRCVGVINVIVDVTEQRQAELLLHATFNQASTLIGVLDLAGKLVDANDAALMASGLSREKEVGLYFWETSWWNLSDEVKETVRAAVKSAAEGKVSRFESAYFTTAGEERWTDLCITPMTDSGLIVAILAEGRDITELKQARLALESARDAAERASQAKDDFLAALSHELRTPLNPVLLLATEGAQNSELPQTARADFDMIAKNVALEARLIDDLLDLTRITRGKMALDLRPLDIHAVLQDALNTVQSEVEGKALVLSVKLAAGPRNVMADSVRMQQVFWNIIKNAVKFTARGGRVEIETRTDPASGVVVICITDNGIGMTEEELSRIFEAFSQGDHAGGGGSHVFGGLGLGLAISRMLVELHSGRISAASSGHGAGASFTIELPLIAAALPPVDAVAGAGAQTALSDVQSLAQTCRILLLEDHESTRITLTQLLKRRRYNVVAAGSVAEARAIVDAGGIDILVSDIGLPDGDGLELMADLRSRHAGLVGIAMTGYGTEQDISHSREAGFVTHLVKPVRLEALESALSKAVAACADQVKG